MVANCAITTFVRNHYITRVRNSTTHLHKANGRKAEFRERVVLGWGGEFRVAISTKQVTRSEISIRMKSGIHEL